MSRAARYFQRGDERERLQMLEAGLEFPGAFVALHGVVVGDGDEVERRGDGDVIEHHGRAHHAVAGGGVDMEVGESHARRLAQRTTAQEPLF